MYYLPASLSYAVEQKVKMLKMLIQQKKIYSVEISTVFHEGGLYVKCKAGESFLENVEWKMTKVLAAKLEKR